MDLATFESLYTLIGPFIEKQMCVRESIPAKVRLQICLRYLASGGSMKSVGYAFRCPPNTVSEIVQETCNILWLNLKDIVMPKLNKHSWNSIAADFEKLWNFTHCIGAIDGKHIIIEAPPHSGSFYFNYKKNHSINLIGVADAHYRFIMVDVGIEGRRSDADVFSEIKMKEGFESNSFDVPVASAPTNSEVELPLVMIGDEAYPLSTYFMRPYPRSSELSLKQKVFNYRLSRARRIIENAFGILAARWRIFRRAINTYISKAEKMVLATVCLHHFIISREMQNKSQERRYTKLMQKSALLGMKNLKKKKFNSRHTNLPKEYRERFANYFVNEGAVEWQWKKAENNEF